MNIDVGPAELETNILKYKSVLFTLSKNIFMNINVRLAELGVQVKLKYEIVHLKKIDDKGEEGALYNM